MGDTNSNRKILITGGTSGLGKCLAQIYLNENYEVFVTGLKNKSINQERLNFIYCDFSDFSSVIRCADQIADLTPSLNLLINNAGILSPPDFIETSDGFEKSYQVNFLAHFLFTSLLRKRGLLSNGRVINVSSPLYRSGSLDHATATNRRNYRALRAYSNSKLYMAILSIRLANEGVACFTFNPGTFGSGIYRSQYQLFRMMYHVAAPFMSSANSVAFRLSDIIKEGKTIDGRMVNKNGKSFCINMPAEAQIHRFWKSVEKQLVNYL